MEAVESGSTLRDRDRDRDSESKPGWKVFEGKSEGGDGGDGERGIIKVGRGSVAVRRQLNTAGQGFTLRVTLRPGAAGIEVKERHAAG